MAEGGVTGAEAVDLIEREAAAAGIVSLTPMPAVIIAGLDERPASIPFFLQHARRLLREEVKRREEETSADL